MTNMKNTLLAAVAACAIASQAQATVVFTLANQVYSGQYGGPLSVTLAISDAAVARGAFTLDERVSSGPGPNVLTGDAGDFQSLTFVIGTSDSGTLTPTRGYYTGF